MGKNDGRTLPPPGRRPAPPQRASAEPELPVAPPRPRFDTLRGVGDDEPLDHSEAEAALRAAEERERRLLAELQRAQAQAARAAAQAPPVALPLPPVVVEEEPNRSSRKTASVAPGTDQALGRVVRHFLGRAAVGLLMAAVGGGAAVGVDRTAAPKVDVASYEDRINKLEKRVGALVDDDKAWKQRAAQVFNCRSEQQLDVNQQLLPSPDRLVNPHKPRAFIDECPVKIKPPD